MAFRAVGYSRLSKEDLNKQSVDSESIKNQNNMISEYILKNGWSLQEIYSDDDFRGSDRSRPGFNRMLSDAFQHNFDIIVCKTQSRFARDIELIEKYVHGRFIEEGIRFIAIQDNIDTANMNNSNKKISQLHSLTDTWYLDDLSQNIGAVFDVKRKKGEYIASWPLYGYLKDPEDRNSIIVDPIASEVVKLIFKLYIEGNGLNRIADILNQKNIPNPLKYKKDMGMKIGAASRITSKSYLWRGDVIGTMLGNQMYLGNMVQGRMKKVSYKSKKLVRVPKENWFIVEGTHSAIIDKETWETVQSIRRTKVKPRRNGTVNKFNGKLRCLECSELMYAITYPKIVDGTKSKTEFHTMFRCSKKMMKKDECDSTGITMTVLESHVISEINKLSELYFNDEEIESRLVMTDSRTEKIRNLETEKKRLGKIISDNSKAITTAYMDKIKNIISEDQFLVISHQLDRELQGAEQSFTKADEELSRISRSKEKEENICEIIKKYKDLKELNRNIILDLIDVMYIGKKDKETRKRTIKIFWNF